MNKEYLRATIGATIALYRAIEIPKKITGSKQVNNSILKKTLRKGYIFSNSILNNFNQRELEEIIEIINTYLSPEEINSSFYKNWKRVIDTPAEKITIEQLAHYVTTYGKNCPEYYLSSKEIQWQVSNLTDKVVSLPDFEANKIEIPDYVYIPKAKLEIPTIDEKAIKLAIIKGLTKEEIRDKLIKLLSSGIALKDETIKNVVIIINNNIEFISEIAQVTKNREVRCRLYDLLEHIPTNPIEFLRLIVYSLTGRTLLIKNKGMINALEMALTGNENKQRVLNMFIHYIERNGFIKLATIFNRYKPIFLSFKRNSLISKYVNRISKLSKYYHKPIEKNYLDTVTARLKISNETEELKEELSTVTNVFQKIRLAYALKYRTKEVGSILYRIRNGKSYADGFSFKNHKGAKEALSYVIDSIVADIRNNVKNKKIYIPECINYVLPSTEKQFVDNVPSGTSIKVKKDMLFGIHWENVLSSQIDLDLSIINSSGSKVGWDGTYNLENNILFSGDMTIADPPKGASEFIYVKQQLPKREPIFVAFVNFYNHKPKIEVPFQVIVSQNHLATLSENYIANPNNIIGTFNLTTNVKQKVIGLLSVTETENILYLLDTCLGYSITSVKVDYIQHALEYFSNFYQNTISLKGILELAEAKLVNEPRKSDVNLSLQKLDKNTFINLLS